MLKLLHFVLNPKNDFKIFSIILLALFLSLAIATCTNKVYAGKDFTETAVFLYIHPDITLRFLILT